jgi:Relaxase/Mobilisation nuclease domain
VGKRPFRAPTDGWPILDIVSHGRRGPGPSKGFSAAQIEQIRRTVRRVPEVMVKVTGGGRKIGAVAAHLAYVSHQGELDLETDEGQRVSRAGHKELLRSWHLELSSGQYRQPRSARGGARGIKLVHNITLSMPAPTPPKAVLAAAKAFAREKFGAKHRYAMALHTHQQHPHVHLVVKAEGHDGRRLHIDKAMLREWRQDFARMMREQGVAANATPRFVRGQTKRGAKNAFYQTRRHARSYALRERFDVVKRELVATRTISDPARPRLLETRKAVIDAWNTVALQLEAQGDVQLGDEVRYFVRHLPPVLTDRERLAVEMIQRARAKGPERTRDDDRRPDRTLERSR